MRTQAFKFNANAAIVAVLLCGIAVFTGLALGTDWVGVFGAEIADALTSSIGHVAWAVPFELVLAAVTIGMGCRSTRIAAAFIPGDALGWLAITMMCREGEVGAVLGDAVREQVSVLGAVLLATVILTVLFISRASLIADTLRAILPRAIKAGDDAVTMMVTGRKVVAAEDPQPAMAFALPGADENVASAVEQAEAEEEEAPNTERDPEQASKPAPAIPGPLPRGRFALPTLTMFAEKEAGQGASDHKADGELLVQTLRDYGVEAKVSSVLQGPTVTTFEVQVAPGTKLSKVCKLAADVSLAMGRKVRVVPAQKGRIGFEMEKCTRDGVNLRELLEAEAFQSSTAPLPVVLGRDMQGQPVYADLASMPHVIVAGASGSGKSVGLNVMLASLLSSRTPEELRLLMIDPKVVELAPYDGIPHMAMPVVTDMKEATEALKGAVAEMERRYQLFAAAHTKNIASFNARAPKADRLPYLVIVIDEFADLIMQQGKEVEAAVVRLGQKARAAGIHIVLATQRPSVDVITGIIKANFSSRIAYRVAQSVDSRTILDEPGAENLLGAGDMLAKLNGQSDARRVQCPMISDEEIAALTDALRAQPVLRMIKAA